MVSGMIDPAATLTVMLLSPTVVEGQIAQPNGEPIQLQESIARSLIWRCRALLVEGGSNE